MTTAPMATDPATDRVTRHRLPDRLFHWASAVCTLILLVTGFLPVLNVHFDWVTVHWISGLLLVVAVLFHSLREMIRGRLSTMWPRPTELLVAARELGSRLAGKPDSGYRPGKYSVAQMLFHLAASVLILATIVTGLIMLKGIDTPLWERDAFFVSEYIRGILFVVHGLAALFLVTMIMLHIYFALRPEKSYFMRSMLVGWITRDEFRREHDPNKWQEPE